MTAQLQPVDQRVTGVAEKSPQPQRRRVRSRRRDWPGAVFITPHMLFLGLFMLVPTGYAMYLSVFKTRLIGGTKYVGLANYGEVLKSAPFWDGMKRVLLFGAIQVPLTLLLAFFFAAMFDAGASKFSRTFRTIFFMPFAVPGVVAAVMWSFLLLPTFGPFSKLAKMLGLGSVNYFSSTLIVPTLVVIVVWSWTGYNMTILYTSLKSIPREVTEAAIIEGASLWRITFGLKLAMIRPSIIMLAFINTVGALQLFTEPQILKTFQEQAVSSGFTPAIYVYNTGIGSSEYNLGAAAAVVLALIIGAISVAAFAFRRRQGEFS